MTLFEFVDSVETEGDVVIRVIDGDECVHAIHYGGGIRKAPGEYEDYYVKYIYAVGGVLNIEIVEERGV